MLLQFLLSIVTFKICFGKQAMLDVTYQSIEMLQICLQRWNAPAKCNLVLLFTLWLLFFARVVLSFWELLFEMMTKCIFLEHLHLTKALFSSHSLWFVQLLHPLLQQTRDYSDLFSPLAIDEVLQEGMASPWLRSGKYLSN